MLDPTPVPAGESERAPAGRRAPGAPGVPGLPSAPGVPGVPARIGAFGPFDVLSDWAHELYVDGFSEEAVLASRAALLVVEPAGDLRTARFLRYTSAVALVEMGHWDEAVRESHRLLAIVDPDDVPWRAKALSVVTDAWVRMGEVARAIDALAEAYALVQHVVPRAYNQLSAAMSVGVSLAHAQLFEPSEALFRSCLASPIAAGDEPATQSARVLVLQESALLQATWGAALTLDGREAEAEPRYRRCAEQSLQMMALCADDEEMYARAEVMEGFAQGRLGQPDLSRARLEAAMSRFPLRPELPEVLLARVGLAESLLLLDDVESARSHLKVVVDAALRADSLVWSLAAMAALAAADVREHGHHPAVDWWRRIGREATARLWGERESRFVALHDRMSLRALTEEARRLGRDLLTDPLTGLGNRRLLDERLRTADGRHAVLFLDVDRFKQVNDHHSHGVGDAVLRRVAELLNRECRSGDVVARFGGDEFVVLLPGAFEADALHVGERVHHAVRAERWGDLSAGLRVTVSVGVAAAEGPDHVLQRADDALNEAKRQGRDRVVVD